jgi:two-component system sensor histidine kinase BarA
MEDVLARLAAGETVLQVREARGQLTAPQFRGLRVLVADDTVLNLEVASEALGRLGVVAETVGSGAQAIEAVRNKEFDLVLMDCSMPDIDGFTAAREIRAWEAQARRKRLPIIALTAQVVGAKADAWREAGMDGVIHKPYTLLQLAACFQRVFPEWDVGSKLESVPGLNNDTDQTSLLDAGVLQNLQEIGGQRDPGFLRRIFDLYLENAPPACDEVLRAGRSGDPDACARAAHALKSMSYNVGAAQVAARAGAVEQSARAGKVVAEPELEALSKLLAETLEKVAALREQACETYTSTSQSSRQARSSFSPRQIA